MVSVSYRLSIGPWSVDSADDPRNELVELDVRRSLDAVSDDCRIVLYAQSAPPAGLAAELTGAAAGALGLGGSGAGSDGFSTHLRGQPITHGHRIVVTLTAGEATATVMTAGVEAIASSLGTTTIRGATEARRLATTRLSRVYEGQTLRQIVEDLASAAGVATGEVATGGTYPYLVVHESRGLLRHLRDLALREGLDLAVDRDDKLTLRPFAKSAPDHTFAYGADVLDLHVARIRAPAERVRVAGESPMSQHGAETWHWLAKDPSSYRGEVGAGARILSIQDGAIRTKDAANRLAAAKLGAITAGATFGRLTVLGNPRVDLADAVEVQGAPDPSLNGLFKVTSVRHRVTKRDGYLTLIGLGGLGGGAADAPLGQVGGQIAGALGL